MKAISFCLPYGSLFLSCLFFLASCREDHSLFKMVSSDHSGIHFNNRFVENDSINPIDLTNIYNGGGVGIGDFNNDGLPDIYFTGNLVANKLYLNKGKLRFQDVTDEAGVGGRGQWNRGVAVVDINNDGWQDLYVCASMLPHPEQRENQLYINQGLDANGIPVFKEMASEYGLNDTTHSTMAAFFDYDNDGDLDMYLAVNQILRQDIPSVFRPKIKNGTHPSTGRLYRNDWSSTLHHPVFTNVSKEAGITIEGYGHGVSIADFNQDGWKDIFVTNDFNSNDLLYINNHDGTFTDKADVYFKHTSANGMGQDVIDINNDGLSDVVELDMDPEDNYRKKMMMNAVSYQTYQNSDHYGYQYQYVRNTLQLNQGPRVKGGDSVGDPIFSEIGFLSGMAETDWSWTPLVTDFDNDGYRDLVITNGFPKDITDHDFIAFRRQSSALASKSYTLSQIPEVKIHNYGFKNGGNLRFTDVTTDWGLTQPSFSNGAAYADLDNDGDMDMVVNNINDEAMVYENTLMGRAGEDHHFLAIRLVGDSLNRNGLGAWIDLYYGGHRQSYEQSPYRGYLSTVQLNPQFGLGKTTRVDSVVVRWPDGRLQVAQEVPVDQTLTMNHQQAGRQYSWVRSPVLSTTLLENVTDVTGISYQHQQQDFIDFNIQKLLPHKFSEYGPSLAAGDLDGNGLQDLVISSPGGPQAFLQQGNGSFIQKTVFPPATPGVEGGQGLGMVLFDADNDRDLDLYIAGGGYEAAPHTRTYRDQFFVNDGKGHFTLDTTVLPLNLTSKACVRAMDYDGDGDLDLFVAGRVDPWNYPRSVSSFIYRNDTRDGHIKFTDVTAAVAPALKDIGLVCDALWTDFDGDGWPDLILAGEWMPLKFFRNEHGRFRDVSQATGTGQYLGWWNSLTSGDFDNDGDMDYVVGNLGENSYYQASGQYPVSIYAKDFDHNGVLECIPTKFLRDQDGHMKEFTAQTRDDVVEQMPFIRKRFPTYKAFATAGFDQLFTPEERKGMIKKTVNYLKTALLRNQGHGKFTLEPLPVQAQFSMVNGMITEDLDGDGNLDLLMAGNDFGSAVDVGRYDAFNGLVLKGNGKGQFTPLSLEESGWFLPGNAKSLAAFKTASGKTLVAASQNKGPLILFEIRKMNQTILLQPDDLNAVLLYRDGRRQKQEFNYGSSFLSQSARFLDISPGVQSVEVKNARGMTRVIRTD